jgi:uncharacterized membrane protein
MTPRPTKNPGSATAAVVSPIPESTAGVARLAGMSWWLLAFAVLSLTFFILLVFFRIEFPPYPLMSYQDALDVLTPLALIPIYGLLFLRSAEDRPGLGAQVAFLVLAVLWVEGHAMHLAANSISNLMVGLSKRGVIDLGANNIFGLTDFFDEHLGHYLWHLGLFGLTGLLIYREWRRPAGLSTVWWVTIVAGVVYGFTLFAMTDEGNTVPLALPSCLVVTILGLVWGRPRLRQQPVLAFFLLSCGVAALLYIGWGLYWSGFPGLCEAGFC